MLSSFLYHINFYLSYSILLLYLSNKPQREIDVRKEKSKRKSWRL